MRQGKLGLPRPLGIGVQFSSSIGRQNDVPDIIENNYVNLVNEMLSIQTTTSEEVLAVCYENNSTWVSTGIIREEYGKLTKPDLYDIDGLEFDNHSNLMNKAFTIHTHPNVDDFISALSINDILVYLSTINVYGSEYIGEAAVARKNGDIVVSSITSPTDIDESMNENLWRIDNALEEFSRRINEGEIQGVPGTDKFKEPIKLPGFGVTTEFETVTEVRNRARNELSELGFKIQTTKL
jgi:hypothetical protein